MENIIKVSSYTEKLPNNNCTIKVAIKKENWNINNAIKLDVYENAIYEDGFVSIDGGINYYLGSNFIFHKLKRKK